MATAPGTAPCGWSSERSAKLPLLWQGPTGGITSIIRTEPTASFTPQTPPIGYFSLSPLPARLPQASSTHKLPSFCFGVFLPLAALPAPEASLLPLLPQSLASESGARCPSFR